MEILSTISALVCDILFMRSLSTGVKPFCANACSCPFSGRVPGSHQLKADRLCDIETIVRSANYPESLEVRL